MAGWVKKRDFKLAASHLPWNHWSLGGIAMEELQNLAVIQLNLPNPSRHLPMQRVGCYWREKMAVRAVMKNKSENKLIDNRHLETVGKLKKRSKWFKLPMLGGFRRPRRSETPAESETEHELTALKMWWISNWTWFSGLAMSFFVAHSSIMVPGSFEAAAKGQRHGESTVTVVGGCSG